MTKLGHGQGEAACGHTLQSLKL